jgi:hypothetical protein
VTIFFIVVNQSAKTILHALRDCLLLMQLWLHLVPLDIREESFNCDLQHWIHFNINSVVIWRVEVELDV